jgi:hypothetical protein
VVVTDSQVTSFRIAQEKSIPLMLEIEPRRSAHGRGTYGGGKLMNNGRKRSNTGLVIAVHCWS